MTQPQNSFIPRDDSVAVFRAKANPIGIGIHLLAIAILIFIFVEIFVEAAIGEDVPAFVSLILAPLPLAFAFFLIIQFKVRYELHFEALHLRCGPFNWKIPYEYIRETSQTTLSVSFLSTGWRMPGFALGPVHYWKEGLITMCATRYRKDILLLTTDFGRYGITPSDASGFMADLQAKIPATPLWGTFSSKGEGRK